MKRYFQLYKDTFTIVLIAYLNMKRYFQLYKDKFTIILIAYTGRADLAILVMTPVPPGK